MAEEIDNGYNNMELIIVTGLSGAGKSKTVATLEDMSFYCIDNMPPELIHPFVDICRRTKIKRIALVVDVRGGILFNSLLEQLKRIDEIGVKYKILFLDAADDVLIIRFKETRRKHPLLGVEYNTISKAISAEREKLGFLKMMANFVIDTGLLTSLQLKEKIGNIFMLGMKNSMVINCVSFGFKNGLPQDTDLVFDVRCLPNPFYEPDLKYRTGIEKCVQDYVLKWPESKIFKEKLLDMMDFLIPLYQKEGKGQLVISIGCTGGKHRSVTFIEILSKYLIEKRYRVFVTHRDIEKQ